ncbi:MAG TPA: ATP synthase F1 subunit epsilon [Aggregatilinea sp.]|jgi:F-type H+-transporting ATPase subunit epsilon|uniref:ATP synthase F1 subunit epsilon n=1 Tax=Aggregatilinea sp. TaxID=2806333 RepID=UPI002C354CC9|nr:ATP synthase F1 subunit epsilon [Aggregatilinea sp.]HML21672.1 ATP synthase F1 subunit epsilon [Aggregatilinea sp.]
MPIEVEVVSRLRELYHTTKATLVVIPGSEGQMGVLPNHTPLLTTLNYGELRIVEGHNEVSFVVYGGIVDVRPDKVTVLADDAESVYDINVDEVEAARERARQLMLAHPTDAQRAEIAQELRRAEIAVRIRQRVEASGHQIRVLDDTNAG